MSDDNRKAQPETDSIEVPDNYEFRGAPWMKIPEDHGEHLVQLAEVVEEIVDEIRGKAYDRKQVDMAFRSGEELDYNMIHLTIDAFPKAIRDLGEHIEEARSSQEEQLEEIKEQQEELKNRLDDKHLERTVEKAKKVPDLKKDVQELKEREDRIEQEKIEELDRRIEEIEQSITQDENLETLLESYRESKNSKIDELQDTAEENKENLVQLSELVLEIAKEEDREV